MLISCSFAAIREEEDVKPEFNFGVWVKKHDGSYSTPIDRNSLCVGHMHINFCMGLLLLRQNTSSASLTKLTTIGLDSIIVRNYVSILSSILLWFSLYELFMNF